MIIVSTKSEGAANAAPFFIGTIAICNAQSSFIFDFHTQKAGEFESLQAAYSKTNQFFRYDFRDTNSAYFRIGERDPFQTGSVKFSREQIASRKLRPLEPASVEHGIPHRCVCKSDIPESATEKIDIFGLQPLESEVLLNRFGQIRTHEFAIGEFDPMKCGTSQIGIR